MPIRTGLCILICCGAGLTACTAAAPKGPDATVTTPKVSRPPAPVSAQAALSAEAFTPFAGLGASTDDGLAPGDTYTALHTACMNAAGYGQYNAQFAHSMAGIETMNDEISTDVVQDADFKRATKAWSACMARSGFSSRDPNTLAQQELTTPGLDRVSPGVSASPTAAQNQAQIATAVADAECTQATDLRRGQRGGGAVHHAPRGRGSQIHHAVIARAGTWPGARLIVGGAGQQSGHDRGSPNDGLGGQLGLNRPAFAGVGAGGHVGPGHLGVGDVPGADLSADRGPGSSARTATSRGRRARRPLIAGIAGRPARRGCAAAGRARARLARTAGR